MFYEDFPQITVLAVGTYAQRPSRPEHKQHGYWAYDTETLYLVNNDRQWVEVQSNTVSTDELIKVTIDDTTAGFLANKLEAGDLIQLSTVDVGNGELVVRISVMSHTHSANDITNGVFDVARIPALPYAALSHTHDATHITSGVLDAERIPVLSYATVSHTHDASDTVSGVFNVARIPALPYAPVTHTHDAGDTVSGVFDVARIPALSYAPTSHTHDASDIVSGMLHEDRIPPLHYAGVTHYHVASDIVSGTLNVDRIPPLPYADDVHTHDAGDIVSGTLDAARIPSLPYANAVHTHDAEDTVSGVFDVARIPALPYANAVHTHVLSDITDAGALAGLNKVGLNEIDNGTPNTYLGFNAFGQPVYKAGTSGGGGSEPPVVGKLTELTTIPNNTQYFYPRVWVTNAGILDIPDDSLVKIINNTLESQFLLTVTTAWSTTLTTYKYHELRITNSGTLTITDTTTLQGV